MIRDYTDQAANERTFLAWVRTGIAVTTFGLFIEKFNMFIAASQSGLSRLAPVGGLAAVVERYDGLALAFLGIVVTVIAAIRFAGYRTQISNVGSPRKANVGWGAALLIILAFILAAAIAYLVLDCVTQDRVLYDLPTNRFALPPAFSIV